MKRQIRFNLLIWDYCSANTISHYASQTRQTQSNQIKNLLGISLFKSVVNIIEKRLIAEKAQHVSCCVGQSVQCLQTLQTGLDWKSLFGGCGNKTGITVKPNSGIVGSPRTERLCQSMLDQRVINTLRKISFQHGILLYRQATNQSHCVTTKLKSRRNPSESTSQGR